MENTAIAPAASREWRCYDCGKLLGLVQEGRLFLRLSRGHTYLVGFPATTVCRGCRALNELATPAALERQPPSIS